MANERGSHYQADRDAAHRLRSGVLAYPVIFVIVTVFTPYYSDYSLLVTFVGAIILVATVTRILCAWMFDYIYQLNPVYWKVIYAISTLGLSAAWSLLSMASIYYYGWGWTTMVTCLSAAAFSAGAVITFSIDLRLVMAYLMVMIVPTLVVTIILETQESLTVTFLFGTYLLFLVNSAKQLNKEYWVALKNAQLLDDRARELEAKNTELESFAYSVSHDLRTPLRSIDGFSELLIEESGDKLQGDQKDYLHRIRNAAQRMGVIIDDLLQLSRITRANINPERVNLSDLVESNIAKMQQLDPQRRVEVEIEPNIFITGDISLMDVAVQNMVSNAWKYSSKNPTSKIRFASTNVDGEIAYYIKDNGVGFDDQYSSKLFSPFQRLHGDAEFPGTGIGLATVKRIMQRHGGQVWANAKVNKGTTVYFTMHNPAVQGRSNNISRTTNLSS